MKPFYLFLAFCLVYSIQVQSQVKPIKSSDRKIEFNFSDPDEITIPKWMEKGDFYQVMVHNINLNNYRVEMTIKDSVYYSSAIDFPVFGSIDISSLEGVVKELSASEIEPIAAQQSLEFADNIPEQIREFLEKQQAQVRVESEKFKALTDRIDEERFDIMIFKVKAKSETADFDLTDFKIDEKIKAFEQIKTELSSLNSSYSKDFKAFTDFFQQSDIIDFFKGDIGPVTQLKQEKEKTEKAYSTLKAGLSKAITQISTDNVNKILTSVIHLYTNNTFTSLPIQFTGDEAELKMSFIPKDSASNLQVYHLSPVKFGKSPWYWAVGPGMYFSGLSNERVGFETINVTDSTQQFKVLEENPQEGEIGVSALFHAGRRFRLGSLYVGIHASVGTGVSLGEDIRARMLYGGGLSFGEKNHLVIDVGWARGYVDVLAKEFEEGLPEGMFTEKPSVLVQDLDTSWFISVGYMFSF
ncbi:hypothetical protein [Algoriphagus sediminis]|uniref:Outer membrane protein beta-barrel domain-containing protein n=1 Tax=Algoriphagus sediminis TaxID=3057113 RepID=A0ABT7YB83_9BACT|nr:hypothetical protein [Algoriphagus sediminis]MDN3203777.1 hypothetical protein [Algoriphagus sediminis]